MAELADCEALEQPRSKQRLACDNRRCMDFDHLRALLGFARQGSLAKAARELKLSTTTLRKRLRELEDDVGVALLEREGGVLALSPAGSQLAREGVALLARADALARTLGQSGDDPTGLLIVATPIGLPALPHIAMIADSLARFPDARFRSIPSARPLELLPHAADIAVNLGPRPREGAFLVARMALATERLFASPAYLRRRGCPRSPSELSEHPLLSWEPPDRPADHWLLADGDELQVPLTLSSPDIGLIVNAASAGLGIARVPHLHPGSGPNAFADPRVMLEQVLPEQVRAPLPVYAVMPDSVSVRGPLRRFFAGVREQDQSIRGA